MFTYYTISVCPVHHVNLLRTTKQISLCNDLVTDEIRETFSFIDIYCDIIYIYVTILTSSYYRYRQRQFAYVLYTSTSHVNHIIYKPCTGLFDWSSHHQSNSNICHTACGFVMSVDETCWFEPLYHTSSSRKGDWYKTDCEFINFSPVTFNFK